MHTVRYNFSFNQHELDILFDSHSFKVIFLCKNKESYLLIRQNFYSLSLNSLYNVDDPILPSLTDLHVDIWLVISSLSLKVDIHFWQNFQIIGISDNIRGFYQLNASNYINNGNNFRIYFKLPHLSLTDCL